MKIFKQLLGGPPKGDRKAEQPARRKYLIVPEIQGHHGIQSQPPVDDIVDTVDLWISNLPDLGEDVYRLPLQIECRRHTAAKGFIGVHAVGIPDYNPSSISIRVRPEGNDWQWICTLVLPTSQVAQTLMSYARPDATPYLRKLDQKQAAVPTTETIRKTVPRGLAQKQISDRQASLKVQLACIRSLKKRTVRLALCKALSIRSTERVFSKGNVFDALQSVLGTLPEAESRELLIGQLVRHGILDVTPQETFNRSIFFGELLEEALANERQALLDSLNNDLDSLQKLANSKGREKERLQRTLDEIAKAQVELDDRIALTRETIAEVSVS